MTLTIPPGDFKAFLFDCDGTIADSMELHHRAWLEAIRPWNGSFPAALFLAWAGIPVPRTVEMLNEKFGLHMPVEEVCRIREEAYYNLMPEMKAVPEVLAQIEAMHGKIPLAVVSGSPHASVLRTLSQFGILERFAFIVSAESTKRGKPYPDPFLFAAQNLRLAPQDCLVFEDADLGIRAAEAAGMKWVRVYSSMVPAPFNG